MAPAYRKMGILTILIILLTPFSGLPLESSSDTEQVLGYPHLIYPLLTRYPIESHVDHTSPNYTRDR